MAKRCGTPEQFWAKVRKTRGCWLWTGKLNRYGYGLVRRRHEHNNMIKAHRYAWQITNGNVPKNLHVLHKCDVRDCVRPSHLFLGTQRDNAQDMWRKGRARPLPSIGSKHGNAKLTEAQVVKIRRDYLKGETHESQARKYKVTAANIGHIVKRRAWQHV